MKCVEVYDDGVWFGGYVDVFCLLLKEELNTSEHFYLLPNPNG